MKDHEKAQLVNQLTAIAKEFHATQQLRARIAECLLPALEKAIYEERSKYYQLGYSDATKLNQV